MSEKTFKILVAQDVRALSVTRAALSDYEVRTVADLVRAEEALKEERFDLFLLGIHFDESRALELLSVIKADVRYRKTPIIIVRTFHSEFASSLRQTVDSLVNVGEVNGYLELEADPEASEKIRAMVEKCLSQRAVSN